MADKAMEQLIHDEIEDHIENGRLSIAVGETLKGLNGYELVKHYDLVQKQMRKGQTPTLPDLGPDKMVTDVRIVGGPIAQRLFILGGFLVAGFLGYGMGSMFAEISGTTLTFIVWSGVSAGGAIGALIGAAIGGYLAISIVRSKV